MPIYEQECYRCGYKHEYYTVIPTDDTVPCPKCKGPAQRLYSLSNPRIWETYTTKNIYPDGRPVTVRGPGQLAQLENEYHVTRLDDPKMAPPQTNFKPLWDGPEPEGGAAPIDPSEFK